MSSIKVAVRARPLTKREIDKGVKFTVEVNNNNTVSIHNVKLENEYSYADSRERVKHFVFDHVYLSSEPDTPSYASQEMVFQDLGTDVLEAAFTGYNACVFAYGQTGSGKTHTMMGYPGDPGLIPRICEGLFCGVDEMFDAKVTIRISVSYLEIYNERVRDLLRLSSTKQNEKYSLKVREHPKEGPYVQDLSWHEVKDNETLQTLIDKGNVHRTTAATHMHDLSSRSHAIFTISFTQAKLEADLPSELVSKINLVDLAGSERADTAYNKGRLKEGANINKSLVTLGNVIKALAERSLWSWSSESMGSLELSNMSFRSSSGEGVSMSPPTSNSPASTPGASPSAKKSRTFYIPYRDSVLTWLLKDSLGGNAKTIMIATISPSSLYYRETINTLRYAQRAKNIVNKPTINEDPNVRLIRELKSEIERLRCMLVNANMPLSELSVNSSPTNKEVKKYRNIETQASSLSSLTDTGYYITERLEQNEARARELTIDWIGKWQAANEMMQDSDMSIRTLSRRSSSAGVIVDSQLPHLIGMDDDILSTGVVMYHLREGHTRVGREDAPEDQDIVLTGPCVEAEHCIITNDDGGVFMRPVDDAMCTVNGVEIAGPMKLTQGDVILLGKTNMFRFNNPAEAVRLREHRKSLFGDSRLPGALSRCSSWSSLNTSSGVDIESPASSPVSPLMMYNPGPSWMDVCLELERQYRTESERIEKAK